MAENLLQKLEEKIMTLLTEVESSRKKIDHSEKEIDRLRQENAILVEERTNCAKRIDSLMMLVDSIDKIETQMAPTLMNVKPVLVQG